MDTSAFIKRASLKHGERYDYSLSVYTKMHDQIEILCKEHGSFFQKACNHVNGAGCPSCNGGTVVSVEDFLTRAGEKFGEKFSYDCKDYINIYSKILVICPTHGEKKVTARSHLMSEYGCPKCARKIGASRRANDFNSFLEKALALHGDKYSYTPCILTNNRTKVDIFCPEHGAFTQTVNSHLNGAGCKDCGYLAAGGSGGINFTNIERDVNLASKPAKLYLADLSKDGEHFYKVGITTQGSVVDRCRGFTPYKYKIVQIFEGSVEEMFELEQLILSSVDKYKPAHYFGGHTECFKSHVLNLQRLTS